jgi:regulator of protease activity HflC (stomatin/prohibitin superfamily)
MMDSGQDDDAGGRRRDVQKSMCTQVKIKSLDEAVSIFQQPDQNGRIPLVLIPAHRDMMRPWVSIPTGVFCLEQKYGKHEGIAKPGGSFTAPSYRIAYMVKLGMVQYSAPVKECPTRDNVRINVNLNVSFQITNAEWFVYRLGVVNFDRYLSGSLDEGIRKLVRGEYHNKVREKLKGKGPGAENMMNELNLKFQESGVAIAQVTITDVILPSELYDSLNRTTNMGKQMEAASRQHEYEKKRINQEAEKEVLVLENQVAEMKVSMQGRRQQAMLDHKAKLVKEAETVKVATIATNEKLGVKRLELTSAFERAKTQMAKLRLDTMSNVETMAEKKRVDADNAYLKAQAESDGKRDQLIGEARTIGTDAEAEAKASQHLTHKRKHELDMREKEVILKLTEKAKFNLIGKSADSLVGSLMSGSLDAKGVY